MTIDEMTANLERHQVAIYLAAIAAGAAFGMVMPASGPVLEHAINPSIAALLFVTFLQVPVARLGAALRDVRFIAALLAVNFVAVPLVVACLLPLVPDEAALRVGVLLVLLCPCVDYVIVFSGLAGGDSHRLLAATPLLLLLQMALLPVFLTIFLGGELAAVVDVAPFVTAFVVLIVIPLALAWMTQAGASRSALVHRVSSAAGSAMVPLMALVLVVVVGSQIPALDDHGRSVASVIGVYLLFLIVMTVLGLLVSRPFGVGLTGRRAVTFSGVTRNSLVVLPLALSLPGEMAAIAGSAVVAQTLIEVLGMVTLVALIPRITR
ncbi:arsenic resistance protein [Gordonia sp. OPL2]|uniref:arsenic resistance protein n=1 Tax=Gordonia sp. OPL2 TaxID=2486274 RepID=UPI0016551638|nr:bile acid:sodium symporter [Gordonia sp. OPL2]RPA20103.1 arsenic resistance protein [Gordonia sp. OPL2]